MKTLGAIGADTPETARLRSDPEHVGIEVERDEMVNGAHTMIQTSRDASWLPAAPITRSNYADLDRSGFAETVPHARREPASRGPHKNFVGPRRRASACLPNRPASCAPGHGHRQALAGTDPGGSIVTVTKRKRGPGRRLNVSACMTNELRSDRGKPVRLSEATCLLALIRFVDQLL